MMEYCHCVCVRPGT